MRKIFKNIFLAFVLPGACLLASCDKNNRLEQQGKPISVTAAAVETKSMLDSKSFQTSGNKIQIYDFVDGAETPYINDQIIAPSSDVPEYHWPFASGEKHQWTPGVHKFFGWLAEDANMTSADDAKANTPTEFFENGFSFNDKTKVLTIHAKEMTATTPQFDFMYSDIHTRDMDKDPVYTAVPLKFSHLFTAFRITALNRDDASKITIKSITLSGLKNKSAQINFSGDANKPVTYGEVYGEVDNKTEFTFNFNATTGVLTTVEQDMSDTFLLWPQTSDDFKEVTMSIVYDYTVDGQTSEQKRPGIPLGSDFEWAAGVVNILNIAFDVDQITFYINSIEEWDHENEQDIVVGL